MIDKILLSILSSAVISISSFTTTPATPQHTFTRVLPEKNFVSHVVEKDETISKIAFKYYGDGDHWKAIWKDNGWIEDPNVLKEGILIKISTIKPELQEDDEVVPAIDQPIRPVLAQVQPAGIEATAAPVQVVAATPPPVAPQTLTDEQITYLGSCEAGMNPATNTGNGYYGAFQFSEGTWNNMNTGYARADLAPIEVQKQAVQQLVQRSSIYTQFPACAQRMRSSGII